MQRFLVLDELKTKCEKEYGTSVAQFTKDLDAICMRHARELEERQRYNLNEEKKFASSSKVFHI